MAEQLIPEPTDPPIRPRFSDREIVDQALKDLGAHSVFGEECAGPQQPPWYARVLLHLFPFRSQQPPEDAEGFAPGYARTKTIMVLDFGDRLRVLLGGHVHLDAVHQTDVVIGKMKSQATVCVTPPGKIR